MNIQRTSRWRPVLLLMAVALAACGGEGSAGTTITSTADGIVGEEESADRGADAASAEDEADEVVQDGPLQTLINSYMDVYYPYFCDRRRFNTSRAGEILDPLGIKCPHLSPAVFKLCMDYAIHTDWGQAIDGIRPGPGRKN